MELGRVSNFRSLPANATPTGGGVLCRLLNSGGKKRAGAAWLLSVSKYINLGHWPFVSRLNYEPLRVMF